jgi:hypothetical protein
VIERSCAYWTWEAGWSEEGCWSDLNESEPETNFTHVKCFCTHLTSFSASAKRAKCKFCGVKITKFQLDNPATWTQQHWQEPGIWVLFTLLAFLYLPCALVLYKDRHDWKPVMANKSTYFKDQFTATTDSKGGYCDAFKNICASKLIFEIR